MRKQAKLLSVLLFITACSSPVNVTGNNPETAKIIIAEKLKNLNPLEERLVFVSAINPGSNYAKIDLFSLDNKGSDKKSLVQNESLTNDLSLLFSSSTVYLRAGFSPDFSKLIYFSKTSSGKFDIFLVDNEKQTKIKLFSNLIQVCLFSWSGDSKKVSFQIRNKKDEVTFYTFDSDSKNFQKFSVNIDPNQGDGSFYSNLKNPVMQEVLGNFALSPDGSKIAYIKFDMVYSSPYSKPDNSLNPKGRLFIANTDGTNSKNIEYPKGSNSIINWSPDGGKILFNPALNGEGNLNILNSDGSGLKEISQGIINFTMEPWSPDLSKILYLDKTQELFTVSPDGTDKKKVTDTSGRLSLQNTSAYWSPDGKRIAFSIAPSTSSIDTYIINSDGSNETKVNSGLNFMVGWASKLSNNDFSKLNDVDTSLTINEPDKDSYTPSNTVPSVAPSTIQSNGKFTKEEYINILKCAINSNSTAQLKSAFQQTLISISNIPDSTWDSSFNADPKTSENIRKQFSVYGCSSASSTTVTSQPTPVITASPLNSEIKPIENNSTPDPEGLVYVNGGSFTMGNKNEGTDHKVNLSDFYIAKYEVTQGAYVSIKKFNPSSIKGDNLPVDKVSWIDAMDFCNKLSLKNGLPVAYDKSGQMLDSVGNITNDISTVKGYRLPTEAEWEFAAKGGLKSKGYIYSGSDNVAEVAWYQDNSGNKANPVGTKMPNELGLYDMSGNIMEWVLDSYDDKFYQNSPLNNPFNNSKLQYRAFRGGSWKDSDYPVSILFNSGGMESGSAQEGFGFRIARSIKSP